MPRCSRTSRCRTPSSECWRCERMRGRTSGSENGFGLGGSFVTASFHASAVSEMDLAGYRQARCQSACDNYSRHHHLEIAFRNGSSDSVRACPADRKTHLGFQDENPEDRKNHPGRITTRPARPAIPHSKSEWRIVVRTPERVHQRHIHGAGMLMDCSRGADPGHSSPL